MNIRVQFGQVADPDSYRELVATLKAQVAELVDALDSKSSSARSAGSIPALGTRVSASNLQVSLNLNYRKIVEVFSLNDGNTLHTLFIKT